MFNTEKSMYIKSLKLQNFRNYAEESFAFDPAVNLICGENGQGKTNLLEAAAACSTRSDGTGSATPTTSAMSRRWRRNCRRCCRKTTWC